MGYANSYYSLQQNVGQKSANFIPPPCQLCWCACPGTVPEDTFSGPDLHPCGCFRRRLCSSHLGRHRPLCLYFQAEKWGQKSRTASESQTGPASCSASLQPPSFNSRHDGKGEPWLPAGPAAGRTQTRTGAQAAIRGGASIWEGSHQSRVCSKQPGWAGDAVWQPVQLGTSAQSWWARAAGQILILMHLSSINV